MNVMRLRAASADELVAHEERERQIREPAAMQMAELAMSTAKLGAAESMTPGRDARPRRDLADDGVVDGVRHASAPYCPGLARKRPRGCGVGRSMTLPSRAPADAADGACCTASKLTTADC